MENITEKNYVVDVIAVVAVVVVLNYYIAAATFAYKMKKKTAHLHQFSKFVFGIVLRRDFEKRKMHLEHSNNHNRAVVRSDRFESTAVMYIVGQVCQVKYFISV